MHEANLADILNDITVNRDIILHNNLLNNFSYVNRWCHSCSQGVEEKLSDDSSLWATTNATSLLIYILSMQSSFTQEDKRRQSSINDVRSLRGIHCHTDN